MNRNKIIIVNSLFWVIILISSGIETIPAINKFSVQIIVGDFFIYLASHLFIFYFFYYIFGKEYFSKKSILYLFIAGLLFITLITLPVTYIYFYYINEEVFNLSGKSFYYAFIRVYLNILQSVFIYALSGSLLKLSINWYNNFLKQKQTEKDNIKNELAVLRSQISPKFLGDSLNRIKSIIESDPDRAINGIENLSEIMSYMLYETSSEKVPLDDEINYINNYINLQKVRFTPGFIELNINGVTSGIKVPPLLFMPFLEHTFSSASDNKTEFPGITINLNIHNSGLVIESVIISGNDSEDIVYDNAFSIISIKRFLDLQLKNKYKLYTSELDNKNYLKLEVNLN